MGAGREAGLLDETTVTDRERDSGNGGSHRGLGHVQDLHHAVHGREAGHWYGREDGAGASRIHRGIVGIRAAAVPVARVTARFNGRAIEARVRCVAVTLRRRHGHVIVVAVRIVPLVQGCLIGRDRSATVGHHAGHDRGLQPRRTEQRQHRPGKGALSSSEPCKAEVHAVHLWRAGL
jgi:hypothetical protein